jgi:hypothetical protein
MRLLLTALVLALLAAPVMAGPPVQGDYNSFDLPGGSFYAGRFSESWMDMGTHGQIGNTVNAESWTGSALGTEWRLWCPSITMSPTLVGDTRDGMGTGDVTWRTIYQGGHFWLSSSGPWGDEDYTGDLDFFIVTATYMYVFGDVLGIRSNVTTAGPFDGYNVCFIFSINNCAFYSGTDMGPKPATFPAFMDQNCSTGALTRGGWGSVTEMTFRITGDCQVPNQSSTWGNIKALYGE